MIKISTILCRMGILLLSFESIYLPSVVSETIFSILSVIWFMTTVLKGPTITVSFACDISGFSSTAVGYASATFCGNCASIWHSCAYTREWITLGRIYTTGSIRRICAAWFNMMMVIICTIIDGFNMMINISTAWSWFALNLILKLIIMHLTIVNCCESKSKIHILHFIYHMIH